ncbi:MAG: hypothetical protein ACP5GX_11975, partial [Anaerolineae bacterium]
SLISLLGFLSTTIMEWRQERRAAREAKMDAEHKALEIEKLKLELERMKALQQDDSEVLKEKSQDAES